MEKRNKKEITLIFLILSIVLLSSTVSAQVDPSVGLTEEEKVWLEANPIIVFSAPTNLEPYSFIDETGEAKGVTVDFARVLEDKLGVEVKVNLIHDSALTQSIRDEEVYAVSYFLEPEEIYPYSSSVPYASIDLGLFVKKGTVAKPFSFLLRFKSSYFWECNSEF